MENTYREVLLISEDYIKSESLMDDNLSPKYLLTAIKLSQDVELRSIIGECLLSTIQQKVYDGEIDDTENIKYKDLLDYYIQPFLLYQVLSETIIPVSYKIANFGLMNTDDEKAAVVSNAHINLIREQYLNKANVYKKRLQDYLCQNRSSYPELDDCCDVNLYSSTSSGIWLGGTRGKMVPKDCCGGCK